MEGIEVDLTRRASPPAPDQDSAARDVAKLLLPSLALVKTDNGLGSGFVVDKVGLVATNLHVIAGAKMVTVTIGDDTFGVVEVVGFHAERDLAVLRVDASRELPAVKLAASSTLSVGETVIVLGNPLGLEATVTDGLLSAIRTRAADGDVVLQISAPISPGSSGGPVSNRQGRVIGVSTFLLRDGQNLNFAMPSEYVSELLASPAHFQLADLEKFEKKFKQVEPGEG